METFWPTFFFRASLLCFFRCFLGVLKQLAKMTPKRICPESLRRVPVPTGAQFSLLQPAQKGLQNGSKNGAFWAPKSELYMFGAPFVRNWSPYDQERKCGPPDGGTPAIRSGRIYGPQEKKEAPREKKRSHLGEKRSPQGKRRSSGTWKGKNKTSKKKKKSSSEYTSDVASWGFRKLTCQPCCA